MYVWTWTCALAHTNTSRGCKCSLCCIHSCLCMVYKHTVYMHCRLYHVFNFLIMNPVKQGVICHAHLTDKVCKDIPQCGMSWAHKLGVIICMCWLPWLHVHSMYSQMKNLECRLWSTAINSVLCERYCKFHQWLLLNCLCALSVSDITLSLKASHLIQLSLPLGIFKEGPVKVLNTVMVLVCVL